MDAWRLLSQSWSNLHIIIQQMVVLSVDVRMSDNVNSFATTIGNAIHLHNVFDHSLTLALYRWFFSSSLRYYFFVHKNGTR